MLTVESRGHTYEIVEVLEYVTTTTKSPTPGERLIKFLASDGRKYFTLLSNPGFVIKESL